MAFPENPGDARFELDLVGDWSAPTDITQWVYVRDQVTISRGRSAEAAVADPSTCTLTADNRTGRFSPRNPTGAYYGSLGRNTPLRVSVLAGTVRAVSSVPTSGWYSTPDSVATSITGDIDLRVDMLPRGGWRRGEDRPLLIKWGSTGQLSYYLALLSSGRLRLFWSTTGSDFPSATSTVPVPFPVVGRRAVRVTFDVNNGAGGNTATFYTAATISGPWVQLGAPVVSAGVTSIFDSTASTRVYAFDSDLYSAEVRNGIGGPVVASPTFTAQAEGTTSFADAQGNTWSPSSSAVAVTARRYRFYGEVASWPQVSDSTGSDVAAQVTAAGLLRRLGQGATPLQSALRRGVLSAAANLVAYWPAEEGSDATAIASALGQAAMSVTGAPSYGGYEEFLGSAAVPVLSGSTWVGLVPAYANTNAYQVRFLMAVPAAGTTNGARIARVFGTGTLARWELVYNTGGALSLFGFDRDGVQRVATGAVAYNVDGKRVLVSIEAVESGTSVDWRFGTVNDDGSSAGYTNGTLASHSVDRVFRVTVNPDGTLTDTAVGHVHVQSSQTVMSELADQLRGWVGETAGRRLMRLAGEEGVPLRVVGDPDDTAAMGRQRVNILLELLKECAEADQGLLGESRDTVGLLYRTRVGLQAQTPAVSLSYSGRHLSRLSPVDDDQAVRNDVTAGRVDGSSYRATLDTGPLSTAAPPAGVGRYAESLTLNVASDGQLPDLAGWRLTLGTVDEPRYPEIGMLLQRAPFAASASLRAAVLDADVGSAVTLTGLPSWLPPGDAVQLVQGYQETLGAFTHGITFTGEPGAPWATVGIYDAAAARYHPTASELAAGVNSGAASLSVETTAGPLWTQDPADFPLDIVVAGERMTVTAITGAVSPQTFTVTRAVNGVVKAQAAGAAVDLAVPTRYAI